MSNLRIRRVYPGRDMSEMAVRYEPVTTEQLADALFEAQVGHPPTEFELGLRTHTILQDQARLVLDILDRTV